MEYGYKHKLTILGLVLAFSAVFFWGCAAGKSDGTGEDADSDVVVDLMYPHSDTWSQPTVHGGWVNDNGSAACLGCHLKEADEPQGTPTCASCHQLYPHDNGWDHGTFVRASGTSACATQCHGTDLSGGLSNVSCTSCHAVYPHAPDWGQASQHGSYVSDNGFTECQTACHGTDLGGGTSNISCTSCHAQYPHASGWADATNHGAYVVDNGHVDCATECHGADFAGGTSGVSCMSASCHPDYPHTDPNWMAAGTASGHVNTFVQRITSGDTTACQECHGANYFRAINGTSCLSCHPDGVTHTSGWSTTDHGPYFSARYNSNSAATNCMNCHGSPVAFTDSNTITAVNCGTCHASGTGSSTQTKVTLEAQSDCYRCHWAYPHTGYDLPGTVPGTGLKGWLDPVGVWHTAPDPALGLGHLYYLLRNPLLVDADEVREWGVMRIGSPDHPVAVQNTCGGDTDWQCHFNGYRSFDIGLTSQLCSQYCHRTP